MGSNLTVNKKIEEYINNNSTKLHPVQKEIISHNEALGDIKRMQISISQCHFLHLLIKSSKIKTILEIGTFTGLSTLSMSLALPEDGSITALDKNQETSEIAVSFFKKAAQYVHENEASVKIDGVNVSFKLVNGPAGKEFAVDRGSLKPIDIQGITYDRIEERFPEGHGMRDAIATLLTK